MLRGRRELPVLRYALRPTQLVPRRKPHSGLAGSLIADEVARLERTLTRLLAIVLDQGAEQE